MSTTNEKMIPKMTLDGIAEYLSTNKTAVEYWIKSGVIPNNKNLDDLDKIKDEMKQAQKLIKENYSVNQICEDLGMNKNTIQTWIRLKTIIPKYNLVEMFPNLVRDSSGNNSKRKRLIKLASDKERGTRTPKWLFSPEQREYIKKYQEYSQK